MSGDVNFSGAVADAAQRGLLSDRDQLAYLSDADVVGEDLDLDKLVLDIVGSRDLDTNVIGSVLDAKIKETMRGAPTFTLVIHDPDLALMNSDVLFDVDDDGDREVRAIDVELEEDRWYRLVKVGFGPATEGRGLDLNLTFEHRLVQYMKSHSKPRKVSRGRMTRAEFLRMLVREIKATQVIFRSPELHKTQPLEKPEKKDAGPGGDPGIGDETKVEVKGVRATRQQRAVIEDVLRGGERKKAPKKLRICAIMTITQESVAGVKNTSSSGNHKGPFHQDKSYGPESRRMDAYQASLGFYDKALKYHRANPNLSYAELCEKVQVSGQGAEYAKWKDEATRTVKAFGTGSEAESYNKQFAFTRGVDGKRENTWDCGIRLGGDVNWPFFVVGRKTVVYASEPRLFKARPRFKITPETGALIELPSGDIDRGKKAKTITLSVRAARWSVPPGCVVEVEDFGVADGRWLVEETERSYFSPTMRVVLKKPTKPKKEPRSEKATRKDEDSDAGGSGKAAKLYAEAKKIHDLALPYVYGGGHGADLSEPIKRGPRAGSLGGLDCSSSTSAALIRAGLMDGKTAHVSGWFATSWGKPGRGKKFTVWANGGHVWIEFHDLGRFKRFDTSAYGSGGKGPRMRTTERPTGGFTARHWPGL